MEPLRIRLFGGILLERGDAPGPPIPSAAGRSLLAYLVTNRDRGHTRSLLAGKFWPDTSEQAARKRLSQALWQVQNVLAEMTDAEPYILTDANTLRFNTSAPYWLDVEEFEECLAGSEEESVRGTPREIGLLRRAVELYRGDYLEGFYDKWEDFDLDQHRMRERYIRALDRLVQLSKSRRAYDEALTYALRMVGQDPLREEAHRQLMSLYLLKGKTTEALQAYEACRAMLLQELDAEPDAVTQNLRQKILDARAKGLTPFTPSQVAPVSGSMQIPFVGRDEARAALVGKLDESLAGRGGIVLLEGEAGVGKTRFLLELAGDANWRDMEVLRGEASEAGPLRPYAALRSALETGITEIRANQIAELVDGVWLREVSRLVPSVAEHLPELPEAAPLKAEEEPERMREAITQAVLGLGRIMPHLMVFEDLQWADQDTLHALAHLAGFLADSRVVMVLSYRGDEMRRRPEAWEAIRRIDRSAGAARLQLEPLTAAESAELVRRATGGTVVDAEFTDRLYYQLGGNPFFLIETLRAMLDEQAADTEADLGALPIAISVNDLVERRISPLRPDVRNVMEAAAVYGQPIDTNAMRTMCPESGALQGLQELLLSGLLIEEDRSYRIAQKIYQDVVYGGMTPTTRQLMHRVAGELLESRTPDDVEALATHFARAGAAGSAVPYLHEAGRRAMNVYAYETAAGYYERAIEMMDRAELESHGRVALLRECERVFDVLGRRAQQEEVIERWRAEVEGGPGETEVDHRRAWLLAHTDRFDAAVRLAKQSLASEGAASGGSTRVALGMALSWSGRPGDAVQFLEEAVAIYGDAEQAAVADARSALGTALSELGEYDAARRQLEAAVSDYDQVGERRGLAEALGILGTISMEQGDMEGAERYSLRALEVCRDIGYRYGEAVNLVNLGNQHLYQGRIHLVVQDYAGAAAAFEAIGNSRGEALVAVNAASLAFSVLGEHEQAAHDASTALEYFRQIGHAQGAASCLSILGGVARVEGRFAQARALLEEGLDLVIDAGQQWSQVQLGRSLALLDLAQGDPDAAVRHLEAAEEIAAERGLDDVAIGLQAMRGLVHLARGDAARAVATTRDAVARLHDGVEQRYLIYLWHHQAADAAGEHGEATEAIRLAYEVLMRTVEGLESQQRDVALTAVPEHRQIISAFTAVQAHRLPFLLPGADVPTGRPVRNDELVRVVWTVDDPADDTISKPADRRKARLLRLLDEAAAQGALPTVDHLADALGSSTATVRRDIAALRKAGHTVKTRGARGDARG